MVWEEESIKKLLEMLDLKGSSPRTRDGYLSAVEAFFNTMGMRPDEAVNRVKAGRLDASSLVQEYVKTLVNRGLSPNYIVFQLAALRRFFNTSGVKIDWRSIEKPRPRVLEQDRIPTREEIRRILEHGGLKDKAIFLFMLSSGVRVNSLSQLTSKDVELERFKDVGVVYVRPEASKQGSSYFTFITPEAIFYLRELKPTGPRLFGESKSVRTRWMRLLKKAGFSAKSRRYYVYHLHTLRKFFRTSLDLAGVSPEAREFMMGHIGGYLAKSYFRPSEDLLVKEYRKAVPQLTIYRGESVDEERLKKEMLLNTAALLGLEPEAVEKIRSILSLRSFDDVVETLQNSLKWESKLIDEAELPNMIMDNWELVTQVNSKFLVRRRALKNIA